MRLLAHLGDNSYIVGGAVRDIIMGNTPNDIDIATARSIESIKDSNLKTYEIGQSKDFGIIGVSFQGEEYEVAQFRSDGDYSDSRRPNSVNLDATIEDDAERRDFTINAMYMDSDGQIIDIHNGQKDIQNGLIRAVGNPIKRFEEDSLRIIRAHRFAAKFNFKIEQNTRDAMMLNMDKLKNISMERIQQELIKVAGYGGEAMAQFIDDMIYTDAIKYILPEIVDCMLYDQHYVHHPEGAMIFEKDTGNYVKYSIKKHGIELSDNYSIDNGSVYDHIIAALKMYKGNDPIVTLAIMFHDIGKPCTAELHHTRDSYKFIGHERKGVYVFDAIAKRLKFSNKMTEAIKFVILNHMRFHTIPKKASKIIPIRQSEFYPILKEVVIADDSCRGEAFDKEHLDSVFDAIEKIYKTFGAKAEFDAKMKGFVDGNLIMSLRPEIKGNDIGIVISKAKDFVIEREFNVTKEDVQEYIIQYKITKGK